MAHLVKPTSKWAFGLALLMVGAVGAACSAAADDGGGGDGDGSGASGSDGNGGAGGTNLLGGTGVGGSTTGCTDVGCINAGIQGGCDMGLPIGGGDPLNGARAMGLCSDVATAGWGVTDAKWVKPDGSPLTGPNMQLGYGVLTNFGPNVSPQEGESMLVLSTGSARLPGDPGYLEQPNEAKDYDPFFPPPPHPAPPGYPKESPSCPGVTTGDPYDSAGLELTIRTPTDAKSLSFNLNFYTYEFPTYICTEWNDFFVALMTPTPAGLSDANISFDSMGNVISVNAGFLQVCSPQVAGMKNFECPFGTSELAGTGFEGAAATSWLQTTAPIDAPGSDITLRFTTWDSGDGYYDSTTLIDNFQFVQQEGSTGTVPIPK